ncbi:MAG: sugar ABC transporter substrate-binding protein [Oscillospiraceae bacterium]|jgi:putative aldouronate transport system substrate-binding protein|nr:sugar ABC transporter substrate-binding protein [Oscillospiraceae bacterium]
MAIKRIVSLALAAFIALALAAFPAAAESAQPDLSAARYGMEPFENPVTIRIPVFDRARDDVPDVSSNYYTKWVNEAFGKPLNVTVEFVPITRTDTMGAYNLLLAGGDWPTVFMEYDWPKVTQWDADGALAKIDVEEFAAVAPTWTELAGGLEQFAMFTMNGEQKVLPALRPYWDTNYTYATFYRKDWYEQAGIELFTTYEEYVDAMALFMELGFTNGKPILPKAPFSENFQVYGDSEWPRSEEEWAMYSDVSVAPLPARGAYYSLKKQNSEYHLGLYNTEFELDVEGTGSASQAITDFINGEAYSYANYLGADMPDLTAFYENNPDAKLGVIYNNTVYDPWVDAMGGHTVPQGRATNPAGMFVGFSSKASADELKAAYMYMEWVAQPDVLFFYQNGVEGETYTMSADGLPEIVGGYTGDYWMGYGNNKDYWCIAIEVRTVGTIEQTIAAISPKGLPQDFTQELIDNYYILKAYANDGLLYVDPFFSTNIDSVSEYAGDLKAKFQEYATALVKCDPEEFDALYEKYVAEYKAAGYQEIMDERLAAYQNGLSTLLPDVAAGRAPYAPSDITEVVTTKYTIGQ